GDAVHSYQDGQSPQIVHRARRVSALAFVPGESNALVGEPNAVRLLSPAFGIQTIADQGLEDVSAVAEAGDGSRVFIATRSGRVVIHDLRSSVETSVTCACSPGVLTPLRGNAVFRLNEMGDGPLWLLDADSTEPRILFVAAPAGGSR